LKSHDRAASPWNYGRLSRRRQNRDEAQHDVAPITRANSHNASSNHDRILMAIRDQSI
jgi:hypothetical protein